MSTTTIVGLDLSLTATGIATDTTTTTIKPKSLAGPERLTWITERMLEHLPIKVLVVLEGYAYGRNNQAHQLGELGGVIRTMLWNLHVPYVVVPPATLKKYATGKGNAGKEEVLAAAIRRLGYEGHDNNEADALWLRAMGCAAYGQPLTDMPKASDSVVGHVLWPDLGEAAA